MHSKWPALAGVVFALFFVVGVLISTNSPDTTESDQAITDWYSDSGHQNEQLAGAYLLTLASIAAVVFVSAGLGPLLANSAHDEAGRTLAATVRPVGILMAACIAIGAFAIASCSAQAKFDGIQVDPGVARFLPSVGYGAILVGGALSGAYIIAVSSLVALREHAFAAWLAWLGLVCAALLLGGIVFLPMAALPVWFFVASISFLVPGSRRLVAANAS